MTIRTLQIDTILSPDRAQRLADALAAQEDEGWSYVVEPLPGGKAVVRVVDEDGHWQGNL